MSSQLLHDIARRLRDNVTAGHPDQAAQPMKLSPTTYRDPQLWEHEMREVFREVPLLVALSCDIPQPGDYQSLEIAARPILIVRGDDGRARTFLNVCRHRGALLTEEPWGNAQHFVCPYHSWAYDRNGVLRGVPGQETFGDLKSLGVTGLIELPTDERSGAIFTTLNPKGKLDLDAWLDGMDQSLAALRLDDMHPYRKTTTLDSPNWKLAADGYLDGYHIGHLHKDSIGRKSITNRNTYDLFGPHVRIGFATKRIGEIEHTPEAQWWLPDYMSLVHYVFPNVSIAGGIGDTVMVSRLFPGPTVDRSVTVQHQYFREPIEGKMIEQAEEKRRTYEAVVRDEDYNTIFGVNRGLAAMQDEFLVFGRNEPGNQHLHRCLQEMTTHE